MIFLQSSSKYFYDFSSDLLTGTTCYLGGWLELDRTVESLRELVWAEVVGGVLLPDSVSLGRSEEPADYLRESDSEFMDFLLWESSLLSSPGGFLSFLNSSTLVISPSNRIFLCY